MSQLPVDIYRNIVGRLAQRELVQLLRVSRMFRLQTEPFLYRRVNYDNDDRILRQLASCIRNALQVRYIHIRLKPNTSATLVNAALRGTKNLCELVMTNGTSTTEQEFDQLMARVTFQLDRLELSIPTLRTTKETERFFSLQRETLTELNCGHMWISSEATKMFSRIGFPNLRLLGCLEYETITFTPELLKQCQLNRLKCGPKILHLLEQPLPSVRALYCCSPVSQIENLNMCPNLTYLYVWVGEQQLSEVIPVLSQLVRLEVLKRGVRFSGQPPSRTGVAGVFTKCPALQTIIFRPPSTDIMVQFDRQDTGPTGRWISWAHELTWTTWTK